MDNKDLPKPTYIFSVAEGSSDNVLSFAAGKPNWRERLSTVDLRTEASPSVSVPGCGDRRDEYHIFFSETVPPSQQRR